jgi:hypothetical protein
MNALLLTTEQANQLEVANADSTRTLVPRKLADGRLILNSDILEDSLFGDPAKPWRPILHSAEFINVTDAELASE